MVQVVQQCPDQVPPPNSPVLPTLQLHMQQMPAQTPHLLGNQGGETPCAQQARAKVASCPPHLSDYRSCMPRSCSTASCPVEVGGVGSPCATVTLGGAARDVSESDCDFGAHHQSKAQTRTCPKAPGRVPAAWKRHELRKGAALRKDASGAGLGAAAPPSPSPLLQRRSDGLGLELSVCKRAAPNKRGSESVSNQLSLAGVAQTNLNQLDQAASPAGKVKTSMDSFIPFKLAGSPPLFATKVRTAY